MPKRKLADRILDEVLGLRRPRPLMLEFESDAAQDEVLKQSRQCGEAEDCCGGVKDRD